MELITRKIGRWDAVISYDEEEKLFIIMYAGDGGAIVNDKSYKKAEEKFRETLQLNPSYETAQRNLERVQKINQGL